MCVIGIYTNEQKDADFAITKKIISALEERGVFYCLDEQISGYFAGAKEIGDVVPDYIIVVGGDGTMLGAVRKYANTGAGMLGFNIGRMGFLLDTEISDMEDAIDALLTGDYAVEERLIIIASVISGETRRVKNQAYALNDVVVSQKNIQRIANIALSVNDSYVDDMFCDGIIVSTPTGSTGYSLSAGGPIALPKLEVMLITPVCLHSLASFNMVISSSDTVTMSPKGSNKLAVVTVDGQKYYDIDEGDYVTVKAADRKAKFIRYTNKDFFSVLKGKFTEWNVREK